MPRALNAYACSVVNVPRAESGNVSDSRPRVVIFHAGSVATCAQRARRSSSGFLTERRRAARRASWIEDTFWGRRYVITLAFGDVGYVSLYPLYFGARDRIVPLARDFSMLLINFADADHLKIDEVVPASTSRRMSETRSNTEAFRLPLLPSEGLVPQILKVQFAYFAGRLAWRPILISALFLGLGNVTGH